MLFVSDVLKLTETTIDDFVLLSPSNNKHISFPRFISSDGAILIYLENDIKSTYPNVTPGSAQKSRRLIRMNFTQSVTLAMSSDGMMYGAPYLYTVVDQMYKHLHKDGQIFWGLYPITRRMPDRIFSNDGDIVYLNIYQKEALRVVAVDLFSGQVTLHPEKDMRVVDIRDKNILVIKTGNINRTPTIQLGVLVPPSTTTVEPTTKTTTEIQTTSTTADTTTISSTSFITTESDSNSTDTSTFTPSSTIVTETTSLMSTTDTATDTTPQETTMPTTSDQFSSEATTSSTIDPCEDLLQELEEADIADSERFKREITPEFVNENQIAITTQYNPTDVDLDAVATNAATKTDSITVHAHAHATPLNLFYVKFYDVITPFTTFDYNIKVFNFFEETTISTTESNDGHTHDGSGDQEGSGYGDEYPTNSTASPTNDEVVSSLRDSIMHRTSNIELDRDNGYLPLSNSFRNAGNIENKDDENTVTEYEHESYHAIFMAPKYRKNVPLIVNIHDGPHKLSTTCYSTTNNFFLGMNMAVLSINYRGSIGMGDKRLESIMGFISQVNVTQY